MRQIVDRDAQAEAVAINPLAVEFHQRARQSWMAGGGELISLPADEQATMLKILASVGDEVSSTKPALSEAYKTIVDAAQRAR